jgi:putative addiction module component (TIGR02574 family)
MKPDVDRLLKDALGLSPEARGALAGRLIDSLDNEVDPDAEAAWDAEIARRDEEIRSGRVKPLPWADARREIFRAP